MTMHSVVANYQKQETLSKLKKVYSILNQAYLNAELIYGEANTWDNAFNIGARTYYEKYFKPFLKGSQVCLTATECGYESNYPIFQLNGNPSDVYIAGDGALSTRILFYLNDGTFVVVFTAVGGDVDSISHSENIYVDINGNKKPNTFGKDVFVFSRVTGKGILPYGYDRSEQTVDSNCSKVASGQYCASKIMREGWEINY